MDNRQPTDAELYEAFVNPRASKAEVATLSLEGATEMVAYRRKRKVSPEMRDLPLSDEQIAEASCAMPRALSPPQRIIRP